MRLLCLLFALCPVFASASPAVAVFDPKMVAQNTDVVAQLTILKRTVSIVKDHRVTVIDAKVETATGRKAATLPAGTLIRFKASCSVDKTPMDPWLSTYPNNRCGMGWTALPPAFVDANAKTVKAQLIVPGDGSVSVTPTTSPVTASLHGKIVKSK